MRVKERRDLVRKVQEGMLTQEELAKQIGRQPDTVRKWCDPKGSKIIGQNAAELEKRGAVYKNGRKGRLPWVLVSRCF